MALVAVIVFNRPVPACTDHLQNQDELGVDCGGPCVLVCESETSPLVILWARTFHTRGGLYDVAAFIENPNPFGLLGLPYHFRIYDTDLVPVKDVNGSTYLNPHERALVIVPNVNFGFRTPKNPPTLEFVGEPKWQRLTPTRTPTLTITNKRVETGDDGVTLRATLLNESIFAVDDVELDAVLLNASSTALDVSSTFVKHMESNTSQEVTFTWPEIPADVVASADIFTRLNFVEGAVVAPEAPKP